MPNSAKQGPMLVVAAHPDDEVLGCGGTIHREVSRGREVHVLVLGGVTTSRYTAEAGEEEWKQDAYRDECERAAQSLGVTRLHRCDFKDNRFDAVPLLEIIKAIEAVKRQVQPELVFTHDYSDLNVDHRVAHQATLTAFRPDPAGCRRILTYEVLSSTEYQDRALAFFAPNCYVDISEHLDGKQAAMACYESELQPEPHPRSLRGIEMLAGKRGSEAHMKFAEAFRIVRELVV